MSLIKAPNIIKYKDDCKLEVRQGLNIDPILTCKKLTDLRLQNMKPFESDFAIIVTILSNVSTIAKVRDNVSHDEKWWGFFKGGTKLYVNKVNKHNRPVLFQ